MIKAFCEVIIDEINKKLGEICHAKEMETTRINETIKQGISVCCRTNPKLSAVLDAGEMLNMVLRGKTLEDILDFIRQIVEDMENNEIEKYVKEILADWTKAKEHVRPQLINKEMNQQLLQKIPYVEYLNLAITFYLNLDSREHRIGNIMVTNQLLENFGITRDDLYEAAFEKTADEVLILPVTEILEKMDEDMKEELMEVLETGCRIPLYVVTNTSCCYGAASICDRKVRKILMERFGKKNLWLLPSSLHEFMVIPDEENVSREYLSEMVRDVNSSAVLEQDLLGNSIYFMNGESGEISIAA